MIQAAGRCNREGKRDVDESFAYIFQFEEKENIPGQRQQIDVTKILIAENRDLSSLESIEEYFRRLYHFRGESLDKKKIMEEFQKRVYNFAAVGKRFKLIEENTKTVFVPREEEAKQLLQQLKYQGYTKAGMRKAGQYCIQIDERDFENLYGAGMVRPVSENMEDFYELVNETQYTEETGLALDADAGMAIML